MSASTPLPRTTRDIALEGLTPDQRRKVLEWATQHGITTDDAIYWFAVMLKPDTAFQLQVKEGLENVAEGMEAVATRLVAIEIALQQIQLMPALSQLSDEDVLVTGRGRRERGRGSRRAGNHSHGLDRGQMLGVIALTLAFVGLAFAWGYSHRGVGWTQPATIRTPGAEAQRSFYQIGEANPVEGSSRSSRSSDSLDEAGQEQKLLYKKPLLSEQRHRKLQGQPIQEGKGTASQTDNTAPFTPATKRP